MHLGICRFDGCDDTAVTTVGILPLCALHQDHVLELMDNGPMLATNSASSMPLGGWPLITAGEPEA